MTSYRWLIFLIGVTAAVINTVPMERARAQGTGQQGQPIPNQRASAGTHPVIAQAFLKGQRNPKGYKFRGTDIVSTYAILHVTYVDSAGAMLSEGQALLRYTPSVGWKVLEQGGGAMDMSVLLRLGVPEPIAKQLLDSSY